MILITKLFSVG